MEGNPHQFDFNFSYYSLQFMCLNFLKLIEILLTFDIRVVKYFIFFRLCRIMKIVQKESI